MEVIHECERIDEDLGVVARGLAGSDSSQQQLVRASLQGKCLSATNLPG